MGYDLQRFDGAIDEELLCTICGGVLEEPLQASQCEHAYCSSCILEWLNHQPTCPVDRQPVTASGLKPVPRILKNLLSRLSIQCDNAEHGCPMVVKLDVLPQHVVDCPHNPKSPVKCELGCDLVIPKDEVPQHSCIKELHSIIQSQNMQVVELREQLQEMKRRTSEHHQEILLLKEFARAYRLTVHHTSPLPVMPSSRRTFADTTDEVQQWLQRLVPARVTRWGGMISTPDTVLQAVIRRALMDSGCPLAILDDLMENAHERHWPPGLSTLETRQLNRWRYEQYAARRIAGKQAVVVMASENEHMGDAMITDPGLVMIFAHGIE